MSPGLEPRTRERLLAVALLVVVFMAGALSALAVEELLERDDEPAFVGPRGPGPRGGPGPGFGRRGPGMGRGPEWMTEALARRLDLSAEQEEQVERILERRRDSSESLLRSMRPRLEAQLDSARTEIRAVLTPEQRERFDRFLEQRRGRGGDAMRR